MARSRATKVNRKNIYIGNKVTFHFSSTTLANKELKQQFQRVFTSYCVLYHLQDVCWYSVLTLVYSNTADVLVNGKDSWLQIYDLQPWEIVQRSSQIPRKVLSADQLLNGTYLSPNYQIICQHSDLAKYVIGHRVLTTNDKGFICLKFL